ncbi:MAG: NAD(+)/NADH kinase [Candidatus Aenigmarchaeota archaeon]|nr:NAD(+)/NADH kinase [Candidatus Aenigmarchaeota archaeon]
MFSKVFVGCKTGYGEEIKKKVCKILDRFGLKYTLTDKNNVDLAILIGGDGTVLRHQNTLSAPIFGINPGSSVGYYMTANPKNFGRKLRNLLFGKEGKDYEVKKYTRLEAYINKTKMPFLALNDVLISPIYVRRILDAELTLKGKKTVERNSGILVYTPTGSHAYAASAGAKPLEDMSKKFGVVAIAPYSGRLKKGEILINRGSVKVKCLNNEGEVCIDGQDDQTAKIRKGDIVAVRKTNNNASIIYVK